MSENLKKYKDVAQQVQIILQNGLAEQTGETLHLEDEGPALARSEAQKLLNVLEEHLKMQTMEDIKENVKMQYDDIPFIVCDEETPIGVLQQILEEMI